MKNLTSVLAFVILFSTPTHCQDFYEWKSKGGHVTKAAFHMMDEKSGKIVLLIPREIEIDKLDQESIELAKKLSAGTLPQAHDSTEMRFLRDMYGQLLAFKDTDLFGQFAFAEAGPFEKWLLALEAEKKKPNWESLNVQFAVAHLHTLALEYKDNQGRETEYARFANDCIRGILRGETRDAYEKAAMEKIQAIMSKKKPTEPADSAEHMFVQDDGFPDMYAFISFEHIVSYFRLQNHKSTYSRAEQEMLGIALVENRTMIQIQRKIPTGQGSVIYEAIPMSGRNRGRLLYFSPLDVYKSLR